MNKLVALLFSPPAFLGLGFQELLLIAFVALLVFGGNLPDVMQQLGRTYGKFRQSLNELSRPVRDEISQVRRLQMPGRDITSHDSTPAHDDEESADLEQEESESSSQDALPGSIANDSEAEESLADESPAGEAPEDPLETDTLRAELDEPPPV